jgi:hypothetical protein
MSIPSSVLFKITSEGVGICTIIPFLCFFLKREEKKGTLNVGIKSLL